MMRSHFFSSIAHELRTPLNSIIPLVLIVIQILQSSAVSLTEENKLRALKYLKIISNSSVHLQNVIEDALDISRLENNKFEIFKSHFDIRKAVSEVYDIMSFQTD